MTGSSKWFSSLDPVQGKEYITFGDNSKGKVLSHGTVRVNESFVLKDVALVSNLHFNLLSVSQLLVDGFEVRFKTGLCRVLDSHGDLVCRILPFGCAFRADFSHSVGPSRCLVIGQINAGRASSVVMSPDHQSIGCSNASQFISVNHFDFIADPLDQALMKCRRHTKIGVNPIPPKDQAVVSLDVEDEERHSNSLASNG